MPLADLIFGTSGGSKIGAITLDVLLKESITLPSNITEYPVETGSPVTDAIIQNSDTLSITGKITNSSVILFGGINDPTAGNPGKSRMLDAIGQLRALHKAHAPITIVTGLGTYTDMGLATCSIERTGNGLGGEIEITAELKRIRKATLSTASVQAEKASKGAKGKAGTTKANAGQADTQDTAKPQVSALKGLTDSATSLRDKAASALNSFFGTK